MSMTNNCDAGALWGDSTGSMCPNSDWTWYEIVGVICMLEWGFIHIFAMVMLAIPAVKNDAAGIGTALYDDLPKKYPQLVEPYSKMVVPQYFCRVLLQHALNLGWIGVFACMAPAMMSSNCWNRFTFMWCLVPYMADWCYWTCIDIPELCGYPSQAQTYIVSIGLFCIGCGVNERWGAMPTYLNGDGGNSSLDWEVGDFEKYFMYVVPCLLFTCGVIQKITGLAGVDIFGCCICEKQEANDAPEAKKDPMGEAVTMGDAVTTGNV